MRLTEYMICVCFQRARRYVRGLSSAVAEAGTKCDDLIFPSLATTPLPLSGAPSANPYHSLLRELESTRNMSNVSRSTLSVSKPSLCRNSCSVERSQRIRYSIQQLVPSHM